VEDIRNLFDEFWWHMKSYCNFVHETTDSQMNCSGVLEKKVMGRPVDALLPPSGLQTTGAARAENDDDDTTNDARIKEELDGSLMKAVGIGVEVWVSSPSIASFIYVRAKTIGRIYCVTVIIRRGVLVGSDNVQWV
jgi:hypothetical protein